MAIKIESNYILTGPELGKRALFIDELREAIKAKYPGYEEHHLYADATPVGELAGLAQNGALFADFKLIEYRNAHAIKADKKSLAALVDYLKNPLDTVCILFITEEYGIEKTIEGAIPKNCKIPFWELFDNEKPRFIRSKLSPHKISISDEAIDLILELTENNTTALGTVCSRLISFFPSGSKLELEELEKILIHDREEDAFSLFKHLSNAELERATETLEVILTNKTGGGIEIIAILSSCFRKALMIHELQIEGNDFEAVCLKLGLRSKLQKSQYSNACSHYNREACLAILALLSQLDELLRSNLHRFERELLYFCLYGIIVKKGRLSFSNHETNYLNRIM